MPIQVGGANINAVNVNGSLVNQVYINGSLIWSAVQSPILLDGKDVKGGSGWVLIPSKTATVEFIGNGGAGGAGGWRYDPMQSKWILEDNQLANFRRPPSTVKFSQYASDSYVFKTESVLTGAIGSKTAPGAGSTATPTGRDGAVGYTISGIPSYSAGSGYKRDWIGSPSSGYMSAGAATASSNGGVGIGAGGGGSLGGSKAGAAHYGGGAGERKVFAVTSPGDSMYMQVAFGGDGNAQFSRLNAGAGNYGAIKVSW